MKLLKQLLYSAVFLLISIGSISIVLKIILKVSQGEGTQIYFTSLGYKFSYLGAFALLCVLPFVMMIGYIFRYFYNKEEKDFLKKYGRK